VLRKAGRKPVTLLRDRSISGRQLSITTQQRWQVGRKDRTDFCTAAGHVHVIGLAAPGGWPKASIHPS